MASKNPLGFGENLSKHLRQREDGKSGERMATERAQKEHILQLLRDNKETVDKHWWAARGKGQDVFTLRADHLTAHGVLTDMEVATLIRRWVFETYNNRLALDRYDGATGHIRFLVSQPEE